ncbi:MAG: hypothetical protein MUF44_00370 [Hydrogenophaga sp.]|jgi:D-alanyl-lipoteichoic acid acyltransferase DltB (MBOAT superfamily)|nr:hypothetical protein [Hydrogenophaga sp.]
MLFYSLEFILLFLPLVGLGYYISYRLFKAEGVILFLSAASLVFYSFWGWDFLAILIVSIGVNFSFYRSLASNWTGANDRRATCLLISAIAFNLAWLGYFKYQGFFFENISMFLGKDYEPLRVLFPVGISFYTFIQIGFLIDARSGMIEGAKPVSISRYFLFGSFFPYVTAGPLVLQNEMLPQMDSDSLRPSANRAILGFSIFSIGLAKKLILADALSGHAEEIFKAAMFREDIGALAAWGGSVAYTLQLYFDFSGYSDMALGLGLMFGLLLPLNFNSPLKASNIIDFWRRWHMTMTRFFTNYIYSPVAIALTRKSIGSGYSPALKLTLCVAYPTILTFLLAGIWHGAGWNFVVFGLIHGFALTVNHFWNSLRPWALPNVVGWFLTVGVFVVSLVFFRSANVPDALYLLGEMLSFASGSKQISGTEFALLGGMLAIALLAPNTLEIFSSQKISSDSIRPGGSLISVRWSPSISWALGLAVLVFLSVSLGVNETPFIYYKF